MPRTLLAIALIPFLVACSAGEQAAERAVGAATAEPTPPPVTPAQTPPVAPSVAHAEDPPMPPGSGPDGDRNLATFKGYGDVAFGTAADAMQKAWGGELRVEGKEWNDQCYFMTPKWTKTTAEFNFMLGDGKFVRFGTDSDRFVAPGGGKVGMTRAQIAALYPAFNATPHKYVDGEYLEVADPAGGEALLVFETDAKGDAAKVSEWRVGLPPYVGYVEGCS